VTRILRIETCDAPCPHAVGTRGCRHPRSLWNDEGITRIRTFEDYPLVPAWCPLEQVGPDWRPPTGKGADRGGVLPEETPARRGAPPGSGPWPRPGQKPARWERG